MSNDVIISSNDFDISLDVEWRNVGRITVSSFLKNKLPGIKFINSKLGAAITLSSIAINDSAENYFYEELKNVAKYASSVRYSDKMIDKKNIYQLFEYKCKIKKLLMILETPKSGYEINKILYDKIIKTFMVKC